MNEPSIPPGAAELPAPAGFRLAIADDGVMWLVIDRPEKRNAFNLAMWRALPDVMAGIREQEAARVVIVRGAGGHFGAGADIGEFADVRAGDRAAEYEQAHETAIEALAECPLPTIAMIEGYCLGGGLAVALACDLRLAAADAVLGLPPARLGLPFPLDALARLLMAVTPATAAEMLFSARRHDADWALARGLVNAVHPADSLVTETRRLAADIASCAPLSVRHAKAAILALSQGRLETMRDQLNSLALQCLTSADYREGRRAFLERRQPRFRGE